MEQPDAKLVIASELLEAVIKSRVDEKPFDAMEVRKRIAREVKRLFKTNGNTADMWVFDVYNFLTGRKALTGRKGRVTNIFERV